MEGSSLVITEAMPKGLVGCEDLEGALGAEGTGKGAQGSPITIPVGRGPL